MIEYTETTTYKIANNLIEYIGQNQFKITPENKSDFPIPFKVKKMDLFWEVFDNDLLVDGTIIPEELSKKLEELLEMENSRINTIDELEDSVYQDRGTICLKVTLSNNKKLNMKYLNNDKFEIKDNKTSEILNVIYNDQLSIFLVENKANEKKEIKNVEMVKILSNFKLILDKEERLTMVEEFEDEEEYYDEDDFF